MPRNYRKTRDEKWRENIKTSMLINRLIDNAMGKIELSSSQLKSIEILLRKTIPDLKAVEVSGSIEQPLIQIIHYGDLPTAQLAAQTLPAALPQGA